MAATGALRLREFKLWKTFNYGHSRILAELGKLETKKERRWINQTTDHMIAKDRLRWEVGISSPTKKDWAKDQVMNKSEVSIFTNASITNIDIGVGIYSEALNLQKSFRLMHGCSVVQAEIYTVYEAARVLRESDTDHLETSQFSHIA